ncbi:MAG: NfeD family protein [Rikenellaceae bacterium]
MDYLWIIWVVVGLMAILIETLTLGFAVICFAAGAFAAAAVAYFGVGVAWQLALFSLVSIVMLVALRPLAVNYFRSSSFSTVATNIEAIVGRRAVVTEQIRRGVGRVSIDGDDWKAEVAEANETIEVGESVEVVEVRSVILIVKKI